MNMIRRFRKLGRDMLSIIEATSEYVLAMTLIYVVVLVFVAICLFTLI